MFRHSSGRYEEYSVTKYDCGMKINTVLDRDEGEWQCKIHGKNPDTGNVEEVIGSIQLVIDQEDENTSLRETSAPNPILEQYANDIQQLGILLPVLTTASAQFPFTEMGTLLEYSPISSE